MAESASTPDNVPDKSEDTSTTLTDLLGSSSTTSTSLEYINHLTTLPLSTLSSEPTALQTQSHHLTSSLTSLTHTSYPTFISLHTTTTALTSALNGFSSALDSLLTESLPALEDSSSTWRRHTDNVLNERRKARVVLEQHDKIRDLLDVPLLIETCVRNGYFSEALALSAHAKSITSSYSTSSRSPPLVLNSVMSEVQNAVDHMLLTLLSTLQEPNRKLPALWKAINFIRKMEAFQKSSESDGVHPEEQIALAFLSGREKCLGAALEGCKRDVMRLVDAGALQEKDKGDLVEHLRKYIDLWRKETSDIVAQYTSIFLDYLASEGLDASKKSPITSTTPSPLSTDLAWRIHNLLTTYTLHNLETHLLPLLSPKLTLIHVPLSQLQSILKPLTFCCNSFARIGMDFRGVLGTLFADAVLTTVTDDLQKHTRSWTDVLAEKTGSRTIAPPKRLSIITPGINKNVNSPHPLTPPSKWMVSPTVMSPPPTPVIATVQLPAHVPPPILTTYPPLAVLTNAVLTTFNNLRLIAPISVRCALEDVLDKEIACCGEALLKYLKYVVEDPALKSAREANGHGQQANGDAKGDKIGKEEQVALAVGEVFFVTWVPFVRRALGEGVYGIKGEYRMSAEGSDGAANGAVDPLSENAKVKTGSHYLLEVVRQWEGWLNAMKERT
ncbi:hypothetical protein AAF712_004523 [Marasmius tenuissimus]|uniref:Conserved oligomeric Golgi complex subunit 8 n=1 Tax=Marasmius tenuissimus TaxID=585030 RepID=A0ABR3A392_9AGAR